MGPDPRRAAQVRAFLTDEAWAEAEFRGPVDGLPAQPEDSDVMLQP